MCVCVCVCLCLEETTHKTETEREKVALTVTTVYAVKTAGPIFRLGTVGTHCSATFTAIFQPAELSFNISIKWFQIFLYFFLKFHLDF